MLISDVDIRHVDILAGYSRSVVFMVVIDRWIRSPLDMLPAVLAG